MCGNRDRRWEDDREDILYCGRWSSAGEEEKRGDADDSEDDDGRRLALIVAHPHPAKVRTTAGFRKRRGGVLTHPAPDRA
jgi:hypothetical protein